SSPGEARERLTSIQSIEDAAITAARQWQGRSTKLSSAARAASEGLAAADALLANVQVERDRASASVDDLTAKVESARLVAGVGPRAAPDIPNRVLVAYLRAAQWSAAVDPDCHMTWWALAAIGRVESGHAGHAAVGVEGSTFPHIVGI